MKQAIVVGTGAGGAMAAKELQGNYRVTILEAGKEFRPFSHNVDFLAKLRKTGLFLDERMISLLFPAMRIAKPSAEMIVVTGQGTGGTTTLAAGNALRYDGDLRALGINLDREFDELAAEIPTTAEHRQHWAPLTETLFGICEEMGFSPAPTTKAIDFSRCVHCSRCVLGCRHGAKWDSRSLLRESVVAGAALHTGCRVESLEIEGDRVRRVNAVERGRKRTFSADLIVLAAGGLGTPVILENSGIACEPTLFVDPVLCVAAPYEGAKQDRQILMPFLVQREDYILSPYLDYLSLFFNKAWRRPAGNIVSMMIKLADSSQGASKNKGLEKKITPRDAQTLRRAVEDCKAILRRAGIADRDMFMGTLNAGHPGGMLPLTEAEAETFHHERLPQNLYVADATLFPRSLGNPPIWTVMAMAKRVARLCNERVCDRANAG